MMRFHWLANVLLIFTLTAVFTSCAEGLHIEKRRYTKGFYIERRTSSPDRETRATEAEVVTQEIPDSEKDSVPASNTLAAEEAGAAVAVHSEVQPSPAQIHETDSVQNVTDYTETQEHADAVSTAPDPPDDDIAGYNIVPLLFLLAVLLLLFLLIAAPALIFPWYFIIGLPSFILPLTWFGALLASIFAVSIASKRRKINEGRDQKAFEYYSKWRKNSIVLAWVIAGLMILFIGVLAIVIVAFL